MRAGSEVLCEQQLKVARMRAVSPATVRAEQSAPGEGGGEAAGEYVYMYMYISTSTSWQRLRIVRGFFFLRSEKKCYDAETSAILLLLKRAFA